MIPGCRRYALGVATVAVAGLLAGCSAPGLRWNPGQPGATGGPGAVTADWKACEETAEEALGQSPPGGMQFDCASIPVPRDWNDPDSGEPFRVAMLRARSASQDPDQRIGSLVINPGGPGGSGVDTAVYLAYTLPQEILERFDIVGFDPRGVERSTPVECFSDADKDEMIGIEPDPKSQQDFDEVVDFAEEVVDGCEQKYGDDLKYFSTEQTARDMEAIREAVGDEKLTYLGYSYGTLLGAVYAKLFPDKIRAFVLDGAVDPRKDEIEGSKGQAAGFELAFRNFAKWCEDKGRSGCPIGPDAKKSVQALLAEAGKSPAQGSDGREATSGWVLSAVLYTMYVQEWWPRLAQALDELDEGDPDRMFDIVDSFNERDRNGHYPNSMEILTTVNCVDEEETLSIDTVRKLQVDWRKEYPLFGGALALSMLNCAVWPDQHDPYPYGEAKGAPPILVVGTTGDPATPYEQAGELAKLLGTGVLITYRGEGHTAYPKPGCLNDTINAYLIDEKAPESEVTC